MRINSNNDRSFGFHLLYKFDKFCLHTFDTPCDNLHTLILHNLCSDICTHYPLFFCSRCIYNLVCVSFETHPSVCWLLDLIICKNRFCQGANVKCNRKEKVRGGKSSDPVLEHFKVTVICVDLARCFHAASA